MCLIRLISRNHLIPEGQLFQNFCHTVVPFLKLNNVYKKKKRLTLSEQGVQILDSVSCYSPIVSCKLINLSFTLLCSMALYVCFLSHLGCLFISLTQYLPRSQKSTLKWAPVKNLSWYVQVDKGHSCASSLFVIRVILQLILHYRRNLSKCAPKSKRNILLYCLLSPGIVLTRGCSGLISSPECVS